MTLFPFSLHVCPSAVSTLLTHSKLKNFPQFLLFFYFLFSIFFPFFASLLQFIINSELLGHYFPRSLINGTNISLGHQAGQVPNSGESEMLEDTEKKKMETESEILMFQDY